MTKDVLVRRRTGLIAWLIVVIAIFGLLLIWQYLGFRAATRTLPAGMTIGGIPAEGMTREQVLNALEVGYATPLEVLYADERLSLPPESVELRYDAEKTAAGLDAALASSRGFDGFVAYVLRRPVAAVAVPVAVTYSSERLESFLDRVAGQHDRPPQPMVPLPESLTFSPGQPGYQLDYEASRARLVAALVSAVQHEVALAVRTQDAPAPSTDALAQMIRTLLDGHEGLIAGIFAKDLETGDELDIYGDVAFSGLGVLKIAIMEESYRALNPALSPEVSDWLSDTMGVTDSNPKANLLLTGIIGNGDVYQGTQNLNAAMKYLGLANTFMAAPYDEAEIPVTIVTPANSRTDVTANPDPHMQTTPMDTGLLLEAIYQCSQGGGSLMVAFPGAFSTDECDQMLDWMARNRIDSLIEVGVPAGTRVAHKQGIAGDTHADAAVVFGPRADYVLVVFLHRPGWLPWEESAPLIADIATATHNYFNAVPQ